MYEADELWRIIDAAPDPLKAMILSGANCGFATLASGTHRSFE
jgi:hypothetical protein